MIQLPDSNEQIEIRLKKLEELQNKEKIVYKQKWDKKEPIKKSLDKNENEFIVTAGRIIAIREFGKLIFGHISDYSGKIQFAFDLKTLGEEKFHY